MAAANRGVCHWNLSFGLAMSPPYDLPERRTAARIQGWHRGWLVIWGVSSRRYWAYPLFDAVPGTIVSAADPKELLAQMSQAEIAAGPVGPRPPGG